MAGLGLPRVDEVQTMSSSVIKPSVCPLSGYACAGHEGPCFLDGLGWSRTASPHAVAMWSHVAPRQPRVGAAAPLLGLPS